MIPFLQHIVKDISLKKRQLHELKDHCYVFPNQRAGIYFKKELTARFRGQFIWSPQILSIVDFVEELSDKVILDPVTQVFELFNIYKKHEPSVKFEQFYPWGHLLIKDFDDIDKYLADATALFTNLKDIKEIDELFLETEETFAFVKEFWNVFEKENNGEVEKEFLRIWEVLGEVYVEFKAHLTANSVGYQGMLEKQLVEELSNKTLTVPFKKIVFAGFNALSKAEEQFITQLVEQHQAIVYWDTDAYYVHNKKQEAGKFIRSYYERWKNHPQHIWTAQTNLAKATKKINLVGVPLKVGQAKYAGQVLQEQIEAKSLAIENSAVVLADETLLFPMLYALPQNVERVNITMGYPLKATPLFQLLESIIYLQKTRQETEKQIKPEDGQPTQAQASVIKTTFYSKYVAEILNNPFIRAFDKEKIQEYLNYIAYNNQLYIYDTTICERLPYPVFQIIFKKSDNFVALINCFNDLLVTLFYSSKEQDGEVDMDINAKPSEVSEEEIETVEGQKHRVEIEFIYHMLKHLKKLEETLRKYKQAVTLDTFWRLFKEVIQNIKLPFTGEPLRGLQVMGLLETRNLDFKNIFVLGVNEGILPTSKAHQSFIPFNLRKGFGLPTFIDQDAIYAYHFYHLLQRSENVYLLYNTEVGSLGDGEKSRFLLQLEQELKLKASKVEITNKLINTPLQHIPTNNPKVTIGKNELIMDKMANYVANGKVIQEDQKKFLSPSALTTYINCPMQFYFKYLAELKEIDTLDEDISPVIFGNILHKTIEELYKPYKVITANIIQQILAKERLINQKLNLAFKQERFKHHTEGKNLLLKKVIRKLVVKILETDQKEAPLTIIGLESRKYKTEIDIGKDRKVRISGSIDRIDSVQLSNEKTVYRILDYKTGTVNFSESDNALKKSPANYIETYFEKPNYKAGFQAYLYAYLFWLENPTVSIKIGIYSLKEINKGIRYLQKGRILNKVFFTAFEQRLRAMLTEMFDDGKPFTQVEEAKRYDYSPYVGLVEV